MMPNYFWDYFWFGTVALVAGFVNLVLSFPFQFIMLGLIYLLIHYVIKLRGIEWNKQK